MSAEYTIKLSHPIEAHGEQVSELQLRRPKLKDLKGVNLDNITGDLMIELVAKLADIPPSAVGEIDAADFDVIGEAFNVFFHKNCRMGAKTRRSRSRIRVRHRRTLEPRPRRT